MVYELNESTSLIVILILLLFNIRSKLLLPKISILYSDASELKTINSILLSIKFDVWISSIE